MTRARRILLGLPILVCTPFGCAPAAGSGSVPSPQGVAQPSSKVEPDAAVQGNADSLAIWAESIKPDLEQITGAKFDPSHPVPIKTISPDDLAMLIARPLQQRMTSEKATRPDGSPMSAMEIRVRSTSSAFKIATRTFGLYRYEDKTIYIVPENAKRFALRHGWSSETLDRVPKLALAHELVHALQDQKTDLGRRLSTTTGEARTALGAVSEGQAVWATDKLARKLDWLGPNAVLWGVITGVQTSEEPEVSHKAPTPAPAETLASADVYALGKNFVEVRMDAKVERPSGRIRLWDILAHPPTTIAQLKDPAKFTP